MNVLTCPCGYSTKPQRHLSTAKQMLTRHQASSACGKDARDITYICSDCNRTFSSRRGYSRHRLEVHAPPVQPGIDMPFPQAWTAGALCAQVDPEIFYPPPGGQTTDAYKVCAACPVKTDCLDYALSVPAGHDWGIWAGTSPQERAAMRRRRTA